MHHKGVLSLNCQDIRWKCVLAHFHRARAATSISDRDNAGMTAVVCADAAGWLVTAGLDAMPWEVDTTGAACLVAAAFG